ncbi:MAG TPA: hypothetical protein PKZ07_08405 [Sedimentisphaerales bacterium]|nr:hypothetical protein [Sedimentisphaerales bacterium]
MQDTSPLESSDGLTIAPASPSFGALIVLSILSMVLVLIATSRYGVGVSPDSAGYLCAARNVLAGRGYRTLCDSPYTSWPPLFPTLLAALGLVGLDPACGARLLNAAAMGGIVFVSGLFFRRCLTSSALAVMGICSIVLSFPLLSLAGMAWTEPVFVLLIAWFVLAISAYRQTRRKAFLVTAAVLTALCSLQRYTGVTLIGAGVVLILWPGSNASLRRRLQHLGWFGVIASVPLGLWMVRNHRLTSLFTGHVRQRSIYTLTENLVTAADTITKWFVPEEVSLPMRGAIIVAAVVGAGTAILILRVMGGAVQKRGCICVWSAGLVALIYLPLIVHTHQVGVPDEMMNDRYLAPLALIGPWLGFVLIDMLVLGLRRDSLGGSRVAFALIVFSGLWLIHPLHRTYTMLTFQMQDGAGGYSRMEWRESPLTRWLLAHPLQEPVRSNAPDALYALTGVDARVSPHRTWDLKEFERRILGGQGETLVWFRLSPRSYLFDLDELVFVLPLRRIVSFPDGGVYRLAASPENGFFRDVALSAYQVNGVRNRRFAGDTSGLRGRIVAWVLRQDGWTDSEWELNMPDGGIVRWSPSCRYSRLGDTFEFRCQDKAFRTSDDSWSSYRLHVQGTIHGDVAEGKYRIDFLDDRWPAGDEGQWRVDVARPVYRLYSRARNVHAYTMNLQQAAELSQRKGESWVRECVASCVYPEGSQPPDAVPVFRFVSKTTGSEFYTIDPVERDAIMANTEVWDCRGVAWYAYSLQNRPPDAAPVHRFWSAATSSHFYTMKESERESLAKYPTEIWVYEGVGWYAMSPEE